MQKKTKQQKLIAKKTATVCSNLKVFVFRSRRKPEDANVMPGQQRVGSSPGHIWARRGPEGMPGAAGFVLRDAAWEEPGHRRLGCANVGPCS